MFEVIVNLRSIVGLSKVKELVPNGEYIDLSCTYHCTISQEQWKELTKIPEVENIRLEKTVPVQELMDL